MNLIKNEPLLMKLVQNSLRCYSSESSQGIKCHGFTYYPRFPEFKDPPCEPAKLFMLKKIRPVKGTHMEERRILKALKLDGIMSEVSVIKNTPENNVRLWKIKHLVEITPISFPNGEPSVDDASSLGATFLNAHGEMSVTKRLKPLQPAQLSSPSQPGKPGGETIRRHLRLKWLSGMN